jgi:hypothetical protein
VVSEEKIFRNQPFQKQEWPVVAMFVNGSGRNEQYSAVEHTCNDILSIVDIFIKII